MAGFILLVALEKIFNFDATKYNSERIYAESYDNTLVPMTIVYKKASFKKHLVFFLVVLAAHTSFEKYLYFLIANYDRFLQLTFQWNYLSVEIMKMKYYFFGVFF